MLPEIGGVLPTVAGFVLGVVLAETLAEENARVGLKWPNDLLYAPDGTTFGKVAGILGEAKAGAVLLGAGLNFRTAPHDLPVPDADVAFAATTLLGHPVAARSPEWLVTRLVARVVDEWAMLSDHRVPALFRRWERHCIHRDRTIRFRDKNGAVFEGRFLGLQEDGAAIVALGGDRRVFYAGELRCFW